jgi:hypothetical protein
VNSHAFSRRDILRAGIVSVGVSSLGQFTRAASVPPPVRVITRGPKFHWFGYYDKLEFDSTNRYVLGMEVDFEHRTPEPNDTIRIGMVDLADGDRWIDLGQSSAWCWQQGCMLQWIPNSTTEIIWNDRDGGHFVSHILDVKSGKKRTIPHPIYALCPDGKSAVSTDFSRLHDTQPGYGYAGVPDPYVDDPAPEGSCIYRVDLETGERQKLFSLAQIAAYGKPLPSTNGAKHKFNHLLVNPDGTRFEFMERWLGPMGEGTRMFTAAMDGSDLRLIDDNGYTSHFIWRDPQHILAFSIQPSLGSHKQFYLFEDTPGGKVEVVGKETMVVDGHVTYLPNTDWVVSDTYVQKGFQYPYLFHVPSGRKISLGMFAAPEPYRREFRCDTHPRHSRDGKTIVIDAPQAGSGRQLHLIDIRGIVG